MNLRDFLWDYPVNLKKLYLSLVPLTHILLFGSISVVVFSLLFSNDIAKSIFTQRKDTFVEGGVGNSESLNPLYITNNQVDRDIQSIVFTKFIDISSNGDPIPVIGKSWSVDDDSKTYTFEISDGYRWSDGEAVTADDVVFTYNFAKDLFKKFGLSTYGDSLSAVNVSKVDGNRVRFSLNEINATFFEAISVYILPKHVLENASIESYAYGRFDTFPIGSGPYVVSENDSSHILLSANPYSRNLPKISNIEFKLFPTFKELEYAFRSNQIDGMGAYSHSDISYIGEYSKGFSEYSFDLPYRKKMIFFNTRNAKFANSTIRRGIAYLINKQQMINDLSLDAKVSVSSVPVTSWAFLPNLDYISYSKENAAAELKLAGYTKNQQNGFYTSSDGKILSVDLVYLDNSQNDALVKYLSKSLESEGIILNPMPKNYEQITKEILASRDFEMILYEIEVTLDPDQYNLWHSLKIDYPNLNIAGYKKSSVDVYLERGRQVLSRSSRQDNYGSFQRALLNDTPAIFLFEPKYIYVIRSNIDGFAGSDVKSPQSRFRNIANWVIK